MEFVITYARAKGLTEAEALAALIEIARHRIETLARHDRRRRRRDRRREIDN